MELKANNAAASAIPSSSSHSYETSDSNSILKYYGLKKPNYYKQFQKDIIHLTSYIISITHQFTTVNNIMSFLRILQFLLPCLIPSYFNFWIRGSVDQIAMNVISIVVYIIPPTAVFSASHIFLIVYIVIQFFVASLFAFSSNYFKKHAKLPAFLPSFLLLYEATFGYFFCPVVLHSVFEGFSYIATGISNPNISKAGLIVIYVFSLMALFTNVFFINIDISQNLAYRSISLASTTAVPQYICFMLTNLINIFFGIGVNLKKNHQIVLFSINILLYVFIGFSVFIQGGYIQTFISNIVLTSAITGACFTLLNIILLAINKKGSLIIFFAFVIFFVLLLILNFLLFQNITIRELKFLDSIQSDNSLFSVIKSPNQFCFIAACGIKYAHPIIIDSTFFVLGAQRWDKNQFVFLVYAKFVAIYPEETSTLRYVYKNIAKNKYNGLSVRCIEEQAKTILKQRETEMTSQLKNRLNLLKKQTQFTKHKLEHVWDVVILGNINEIEIATKRALASINQSDADIKRLLVEYPNNRFVTHFYSNFLNEIIGDHGLSLEFHEKTKLLLPGTINVNDQTHLLGLKMFPNLPNSINTKQRDLLISSNENLTTFIDSFNMEKDRERQNNLEKIAGIKRNIEDLVIPSIRGTKLIRLLITLFIFVIPSIAAFIYLNFYENKIKKPLEFIGSVSLIRTYAYHIIAFSIRYLGECLSIFPRINENTNNPPKSFGNSWNTQDQLNYILQATTNVLRDFDKYRGFEENDYYIKQAHQLMFQNTLPYHYYSSPENFTISNISLQAAIIDLTIQQKSIITGTTNDSTILSLGIVLNLFNNAQPISNCIHEGIGYIFSFLYSNYTSIKTNLTYVFIAAIILLVLGYTITMVVQLKWINSNKRETYQCLFSLPKNVVSKLADNRKKENQAEDMNKQNDNIIRTFNSYGTYDESLSDSLLLIFGNFMIFVIAVIELFLFLHLFVSLTRIIVTSAPYLHYLLASYSMLLGSVDWFNILMFEFGGYPMPTTDFNNSYTRMKNSFQWASYYYHVLVTGSPYTDETPFKELIKGIRNSSPTNCSVFDSLNQTSIENLITNYDDVISLLDCSSVDMLFVLFEPIISNSITPYQMGITDSIDPKTPEFTKIWKLLISPIYDRFYEPLHFDIFPSISNELNKMRNQVLTAIIVLFVTVFLLEFILYIRVKMIENHIRSVLKLLLHCNPSILYSSNKIMRILGGDFSSQQNDSLDHSNNFFNTIFTNLPDAIMYANSDMIIQSCNIQCKRVFEDVELVGKSITEFFLSNKFSGNIEALFSDVNSNPVEEIEYKSDSNTDIFLKVTSMMANGKFVMICQDVTQAHNYNTLILSEKQNSDKLLETILPPSLVGRVQQGEKNISLSVQSASILFSDIVSFTPWCGSLPAEKVMSTLNILFKRMDSILDTKPTMTKIKCIGDCYMAAGGIFAEINQPALHAQEVVSFGLLSIKEILNINKEIHENLRIRVGVNTGGPIVAGVLGIGKPTFEIIGPAINRAQQMEQNGIPMKVHISNSVYELICGFNFKFSNRRTIECKNEKVETYLVEP
ncbi:hypothetical protein M9Y10_030013 [Tritrichomonas musculus]|uniref:Guanylate cyclase domain-containing protein n=1 Tax=Tritrichomonas musculus TaxID=1915356 RepID=A0ABR2KPL7_9EUKA